jgi:hypothetical protein
MRKIVTLLAAAGLMLGAAGAAYADPPLYVDHCSQVITVAPNVTAKTCMHTMVYAPTYAWATVDVANNSVYPVDAHADLLSGPTVVPGDTLTIAAHSSATAWGNRVQDPACGENCIGRGSLSSGGWSTYTYSP